MDMTEMRELIRQVEGMQRAMEYHQQAVVAYRDDESGRLIILRVPCPQKPAA